MKRRTNNSKRSLKKGSKGSKPPPSTGGLPPQNNITATTGDTSTSPIFKTRKRWYNSIWLVLGMIVLFGFILAAASLMAIRNRDSSGVHQLPSNGKDSLTNTISLLDQSWGDFDGYAAITNRYRLVQRFPHDPKAFTQGLQWHNNRLIESTGMNGESQVRIYEDPLIKGSSMTIEKVTDLDDAYFGEGLCWFRDARGNDRYIQLTWQEQTAFVYDTESLQVIQTFNYTTTTNEGWGITFDPDQKIFYVSDGSDTLHVWNLDFEEIRTLKVSLLLENQREQPDGKSQYLSLINELEWDPSDETIMANVWFQNAIVKIHPHTGQVLRVFDLSQLYTERTPDADVMNGIAHYQGSQWWVTGKYWPYLYLVELL